MDPAVWFQEDMIMDCKLRAKNCGGCPMLATEYAAQLKKKEADVRALLGKYGPVSPIRGMETPYHYRNKVISTFAPAAGGNSPPASTRLAPTRCCRWRAAFCRTRYWTR